MTLFGRVWSTVRKRTVYTYNRHVPDTHSRTHASKTTRSAQRSEYPSSLYKPQYDHSITHFMAHLLSHFPSDMDANRDDLITVFEYGTYVEDCSMVDRFEEMWLACVLSSLSVNDACKKADTDSDTGVIYHVSFVCKVVCRAVSRVGSCVLRDCNLPSLA